MTSSGPKETRWIRLSWLVKALLFGHSGAKSFTALGRSDRYFSAEQKTGFGNGLGCISCLSTLDWVGIDIVNDMKGWSESDGISRNFQSDSVTRSPKAVTSMNEEFKGTCLKYFKGTFATVAPMLSKISSTTFPLGSSVALFQKGFFALESRQKILTTGVDKVEAKVAKWAFRFVIEGRQ